MLLQNDFLVASFLFLKHGCNGLSHLLFFFLSLSPVFESRMLRVKSMCRVKVRIFKYTYLKKKMSLYLVETGTEMFVDEIIPCLRFT